jgi:hypothetical protein
VEIELMAEVLEQFQDHLQSFYLGWMLDNVASKTKEEMDAAQSFFAYAYNEATEAINVRRRDGSYQDLRRKLDD